VNFDEKVKYVNVGLFGPRMTVSFEFIVDVPGLRTDYEGVDFDTLYSAEEIVDYQSAWGSSAGSNNSPTAEHKVPMRYAYLLLLLVTVALTWQTNAGPRLSRPLTARVRQRNQLDSFDPRNLSKVANPGSRPQRRRRLNFDLRELGTPYHLVASRPT
jgi:hypothetical protein